MQLVAIDKTGKKEKLSVKKEVFAVEPNMPLLAQAARVYIARQHTGSKKVQTRSQVSLTKSKWYRQKGTGNARHGAKSAHIFVGGGVAHGPSGVQAKSLKLSKTLKTKALQSALSLQAKNIFVSDDIAKLKGKTKEAVALLDKVLPEKKLLIVVKEKKDAVSRALQNIQRVSLISAAELNTLHVLNSQAILMTTEAVKDLEARVLGKAEGKS